MRAEFNAQTLAEVFRDLYLTERTGALVLARPENENRIFFDRGMVLYAESTNEDEGLGRHLVREGELSVGALQEATDALNGSRSTLELARVLVNRDLIGRRTVRRAARSIVDDVVSSVFSWESGAAHFEEATSPESVLETDIIATAEVILRGISRMAGFTRIHEAMRGLDNRLQFRTPRPFRLERLTLSPAHGYILSRVDGSTSLTDMISILPSGEEETAVRLLFGLLLLGVLEYQPPLGEGLFKVADVLRDHADRQAMERMQELAITDACRDLRTQNAYQMLRVEPSAGHDEIERAYEERKGKFGRERILPKLRDKYRQELTLIESRLLEAFLTLTKPDDPGGNAAVRKAAQPVAVADLNVRVEMDKARSKVALEEATRVADVYFAKSKQAMREGDFHNAIQYGKLAISHNPSDARYYSLIADCQMRNPDGRWQRMAEENYTKATQLDPWNAGYWVCLGRLYKQRGLKIRAKKKFEEALRLVPNNAELIEELKSLE